MQLKPIIFNIFMKPFEQKALHERRSNLISKVNGNVLELGAGTGINFNYYRNEKISKLTIMDLEFNNIIKNHSFNKSMNINYVEGNAENIPFPDNTFDSVVSTLIYCSIDNPELALSEVFRVLKPGGRMYFIEHVLPKKGHYRKLLNRLNGVWKMIGKCNVNRETLKLIQKTNFKVVDFERFGKACFIFIKGIGIKE
ncbi:class I SAM-dependent methyltransferase [Tepidibacter aestuarii]|uniref:class I SAM-dependent methyltransferase n=1 Tax=Tepidibacter aestuarii TaxID=2925782 RepID=UPI0020BD6BF9|nr:class I SAM-dependent methyltransferase [Tepidibacter aestuarii]CAH2214401.1 conserved protein of unknown function [Tepidibacter aestuarii]